jgi:hypothetical protein
VLELLDVVVTASTYRELEVEEVVVCVQSNHALPLSEGHGHAEPVGL